VRNSQLAPLLGNLSTPLLVSVAPVSIGWWRLYTHLSRGLANLDTTMGADEQDTDDLRRMCATPPTVSLTRLPHRLSNLDTTMGADEQDTDDLRRMCANAPHPPLWCVC
jgi:hypothetical protein